MYGSLRYTAYTGATYMAALGIQHTQEQHTWQPQVYSIHRSNIHDSLRYTAYTEAAYMTPPGIHHTQKQHTKHPPVYIIHRDR